MDEFLALEPININNETVYVNRFGDLWRYNRKYVPPKFTKIDNNPRKSDGYIYPKINGKRVLQHRIISAAFLGLDINDKNIQVDHINGIRHDNRLENLRLVTHQQNQHNYTKAKGYHWNKRDCKWQAQIRLNGKNKHLGYFENKEDARNAYLNAKKIYHII
jgi:hypothetical protein